MVSILRTAYYPTGDKAVFSNFNHTIKLDMEHGKVLVTYMSCICHIRNILLAGSINLPSILLQISTIKGLGNRYVPAKKYFDLVSSLFTSLDLERIEIKCATYTNSAAAIVDDPNTHVSASRNAPSLPAPTPKPNTAPMAGVYTFPPSRAPPGREVTSIMKKAATACPLCHNKHHGLTNCIYSLHAGYVTQHNPEKSKTQIEALDLGKGRHAKPGKNP